MATNFARILAFMGMASDKEVVTEAHLQTANDKIAQLEQAKATADANLATATDERDKAKAALTTAEGKVTETEGKLTTANEKVATLEQWKKNNKAEDGRTEDDSNHLDDEDDKAPKASWERAADAAVARVTARLS